MLPFSVDVVVLLQVGLVDAAELDVVDGEPGRLVHGDSTRVGHLSETIKFELKEVGKWSEAGKTKTGWNMRPRAMFDRRRRFLSPSPKRLDLEQRKELRLKARSENLGEREPRFRPILVFFHLPLQVISKLHRTNVVM